MRDITLKIQLVYFNLKYTDSDGMSVRIIFTHAIATIMSVTTGGGGAGFQFSPCFHPSSFFLVSAIDSQIPFLLNVGTRAHAVHPRRMSLKMTRIGFKMAAALT